MIKLVVLPLIWIHFLLRLLFSYYSITLQSEVVYRCFLNAFQLDVCWQNTDVNIKLLKLIKDGHRSGKIYAALPQTLKRFQYHLYAQISCYLFCLDKGCQPKLTTVLMPQNSPKICLSVEIRIFEGFLCTLLLIKIYTLLGVYQGCTWKPLRKTIFYGDTKT